MDRDVTQRLLKDSIICLCRNHFNSGTRDIDEVSFEIDGLICVSQDGATERQTVFKIHELIRGRSSNWSSAGDDFRSLPGAAMVARKENGKDQDDAFYCYEYGTREMRNAHAGSVFNSSIKSDVVPAGASFPIAYSQSNKRSSADCETGNLSNRKRKSSSPRPILTHRSRAGSLNDLNSTADCNGDDAKEKVMSPSQIKPEPMWQEDNQDVARCRNDSGLNCPFSSIKI